VTRTPLATSSISFARPINVTGVPPAASLPPTQHPIAPAPKIAITARTYLIHDPEHRYSHEVVKSREVNNPLSRFARTAVEYEPGEGPPPASVSLLEDHSRSILSRNDSPDLSFRWSANPYRGCLHACQYCYARPTHEYLDMGAGTDFDTKIVVKPKAAELLRETFDKPSWKGERVMFSGVTDCYQAIEAKLGLTRACLEVCLEYRNPVSVISKSALVERDAELLAELAREAGAHVDVSLAWIDADDARAIEPWAASPQRRLQVIETLAKAGVPVGIMCAPIIPGLNDGQIPKLLEAARDAGAMWAGWTLLRLPGAVAQVFPDRLRVAMPLSAERVLARIRETRGGERMNDPRFHSRGRGEGVYADTIAMLFETTAQRLGFARHDDDADADDAQPSRFRRPPKRTNQLSLF
jgi:DNA repair photolyase